MPIPSLKALACGLAAAAVTTGNVSWAAEEPEANEQVVVVVKAQQDDETQENQAGEDTAKESRLWLGIMLKEVEGDLATYLKSNAGILVDSVFDDSPAAKAGIEVGDILISADDEKLDKPDSLLAIMRKLSTNAAEKPTLKVTLLRNGEQQQVELEPAKRPQQIEDVQIEIENDDLADALVLSGDKSPEEIQKLVEKLRNRPGGKEMNIFRFGNPSIVWDAQTRRPRGNINVDITRNVDGKEVRVTVQIEPEKPAKITVTQGDNVEVYSEDNLDKLPEDVRDLVVPMLHGAIGNQAVRLHFEPGAHRELLKEKQQMHLEAQERAELLDRQLADQFRARALEMAERSRAKAEELAAAARESAEQTERSIRAAVSLPSELKELRALVDSLRQEVKQLRAELDGQKKEQ